MPHQQAFHIVAMAQSNTKVQENIMVKKSFGNLFKFCRFIENLPFAKEFIIGGDK